MNTIALPFTRPALAASILAALATLAACGGGGGSAGSAPADATPGLLPSVSTPTAPVQPDTTQPNTTQPTIPQPNTTQPALPVPGAIANGSTVLLECGRSYVGTLDLKGKSDVTVKTAGSCGNAVLSPGQALSGWSRHEGNVYSAPVAFDVGQLVLDGQPLERAHWPNRPQTWAKASGSSATTLSHAMPNGDLVGATLVFRPYDWAVEARRITGYSAGTMTLASFDKINFDGYALSGAVDFYVEGKLWMLDAPGEWAVSEGRVYVWTPDGQSPQGRVWVAPERDAIDARDSRRVTLEGVNVYGAANGINALGATDLRVQNVNIANMSANGILNSGGARLQVDGAIIRNVRHPAISVHWGGGGEVIRNVQVDGAGNIGMPTHARAAIHMVASEGSQVLNNSVRNAGYIGIRAFRNSLIANNTVDGACLALTDCGGIYIDAPDQQPLNARIENNTVKNVGPDQRLAWGIYLGDRANGVTVAGNTISASGNGLEILNGHDNRITGNHFSGNTQAHIQFVEFGSQTVVRNNQVSGNTFTSTGKQEMYRLSSELGSSAVKRFASYADNRYISSSSAFANYQGEMLSFAQWQARTGQDGNSTLGVP
ncbi:MAG TPA: right-handed parallel beta-helix repeat-containing protein [Noviherbaspirillum sp.]